MPRPTARVLALLEVLQSGGTRTAADLAERLQVDERTPRRYVQHLIDLDVPVESVRGRYGGYRLGRGYRVPPLMFTDDEAVALLVGLLAGQQTGAGTASGTAIAKIRRVLPDRLSRRLDAVLDALVVRGAQPVEAVSPDGALLLSIAEAVRLHRPVLINYVSGDGRRSERTLHPYALVVHGDRWYVSGLDADIGEERTFRLDRVTAVRLLVGSFEAPAESGGAERFLESMAAAPRRHVVRLLVQAPLDHIRTRLPASVAIVETPSSGAGSSEVEPWSRVLMHVEDLGWVPAALASLDRPFLIEEPAELRVLVAALASRLVASAERAAPWAPSDAVLP